LGRVEMGFCLLPAFWASLQKTSCRFLRAASKVHRTASFQSCAETTSFVLVLIKCACYRTGNDVVLLPYTRTPLMLGCWSKRCLFFTNRPTIVIFLEISQTRSSNFLILPKVRKSVSFLGMTP
jgi:hypothetical protein